MTNNFNKPPKKHHDNFITPSKIEQNDIYWAKLQMHNGSYKERPVLVVIPEVGNQEGYTAVMPITSKMMTKSDYISKQYAPIDDWKQCGLKKPSYVDTHPKSMHIIERDKLNDRSHFKPMSPTSQRNVNRSINHMIHEQQLINSKRHEQEFGFRQP